MENTDRLRMAHREIRVPGVHGYSDKKSAAAGEEISFHISSDVPYRLSVRKPIRRHGLRTDILIHQFPALPAGVQPIHPGSYVHVERGLDASRLTTGLSLELWVKVWDFGRRQAIVGQFDMPDACGYGLFVGATGEIEFYVGDGATYRATNLVVGGRLSARGWHHLAATWDGRTATLWVDGIEVASKVLDVQFAPGPAPLRIAAASVSRTASLFLDGDLMMPVLYGGALPHSEITTRFQERGLTIPEGERVLACWPLCEQKGNTLSDASGNLRHGKIVNHATWMVTGPAFHAESVRLYESGTSSYDPFRDKDRGFGIRFARDDLYDCGWDATCTWRIPQDAKPGIYVAHIDFLVDGVDHGYDITFVVKKAAQIPAAPVLVLCSTATWLAYSVSQFGKNRAKSSTYPRRGGALENAHPEAPAFSLYSRHQGGQPTYHAGLRMPWPNASPDAKYDPEGLGFAQWVGLELYLHSWLDTEGYSYDVATDFDLHCQPDLLSDYRTVVIAGHSEYWSIPAYEALDHYLVQGGSAIVLSGNTMCARVSYDSDMLVMEERKTRAETKFVPGSTVEYPGGPHGEQYHSDDGLRGGPLRHSTWSGANVIGLDTAGWAFADGDDFGIYKVTDPGHFLFNEPSSVPVTHNSTFGHGPGRALPRAVGHEWDLTVRSLKKMTKRVPEGMLLPEDHKNVEILAIGVRDKPGPMDAYLDYFYQETDSLDGLSCELIYWKRPQGGRVFNAGAVCASWVLGVDPIFEGLLRNVFHHFGVPRNVP